MADDLEADIANELYLAVASMRAHSGRMRAVAENPSADMDAYAADYREPSRGHDFERERFAPSTRPDEHGFDLRFGHVDAATEHLERARLPDLNALAEMMMKMRHAQHAYEVNRQMMDATHEVMSRTVDLLRR